MESNIDPSITGEGIFNTQGRINGGSKQHDHYCAQQNDNVDNVSMSGDFHLNDYVHSPVAHDSNLSVEQSSAAVALNLINFNGINHVDEIPNSIYDDHSEKPIFESKNNDLQETATNLDIIKLVKDSSVKVVPYNPLQKTRRLGRPRKNMSSSLATPERSSTKNYNEAVLSKFRLDTLPLEGPGSRGGRASRRSSRGRTSIGTLHKRKRQASLMPFSLIDEDGNKVIQMTLKKELENTDEKMQGNPKLEIAANSNVAEMKRSEQEANELMDKEVSLLNSLTEASQSSYETQSLNLEASSDAIISLEHPLKTGKNIPSKTKKQSLSGHKQPRRNPRNSKLSLVSSTTVPNNKHKNPRGFPGPVIGLYYDLYDNNILDASNNKEASCEPLALGFNLKKSYSAKHIILIISFLNKFRDVIFDLNMMILGPQDFESGLGLASNEDAHIHNSNVTEHMIPSVSTEMNLLFCRLLTLVLNRKKSVSPQTQSSAISELKGLVNSLRMPDFWKSSSNKAPDQTLNPFFRSSFLRDGLEGLENPTDRLIVLVCLVKWSLSSSEIIKDHVSTIYHSKEMYGERETFYASRYVLRGLKGIEEAKREFKTKFLKRSKGTKLSDSDMPLYNFYDPSSNPLEHSMRLRLEDMVVGDLGFHIGRFYLCRMANSNNGGLASISTMNSTLSDHAGIMKELPSKFKLYVHDVHKMLSSSLAYYGVEFSEEGEDIHTSKSAPQDDWYEVASTPGELEKFINHLTSRIETENPNEEKNIISRTSMIYKPILNLRDYLASLLRLLVQQESLAKGSRNLRSSRAALSPPLQNDSNDIIYREESFSLDNDNDNDEDYEDEEYKETDYGNSTNRGYD